MNKIIAFTPHLFTLGNLFCGCLAIVFAFSWQLDWAAYMVFLAAFLDFFDGFFARILKVSGDLGKQLDSLADMVSFGVVPGIVMYKILTLSIWATKLQNSGEEILLNAIEPLALFALIIPIFSCYRLAKFNLDTRQTHGFIGLPTPANAIFFCSFTLILTSAIYTDLIGYLNEHARMVHPKSEWVAYANDNTLAGTQGGRAVFYQHILNTQNNFLDALILNKLFLIPLIVLFSFLLVSPIPLFALKFKNFGWTDNKIRFIFLGISAGLLICFQLVAIPFIIVLYILISIVNNIFKITV